MIYFIYFLKKKQKIVDSPHTTTQRERSIEIDVYCFLAAAAFGFLDAAAFLVVVFFLVAAGAFLVLFLVVALAFTTFFLGAAFFFGAAFGFFVNAFFASGESLYDALTLTK